MNDSNPYQAHEFRPALDKYHRLVAKELLKVHEQGPTLGVYLRQYASWLILRYVGMAPTLAILASFSESRDALGPVLCMIGYSLFTDFLFIRLQMKAWPVYEETFDWAKVRKVVEGG